ncbi:MAG: hypothetical protein PVG06_17755 [Desulfobacterales bacterium]|jgi:Fe2+ or Zn2+ uptake regulation protein
MEKIGVISQRILGYLKRHPESEDTLENITKWWLEFEGIDLAVDKVANELESLLEKGLLTKTENPDAPVLYKISKK